METLTVVIILIAGFSCLNALILVKFLTNESNGTVFKSVFLVLLYFNGLWLFAVLFDLGNSLFIDVDNFERMLAKDILLLSLLFFFRIFLLFAFFNLISVLLEPAYLPNLKKAKLISLAVLLLIWIGAWIEIFIRGSEKLLNGIFFYTDLLVFIGFILGSVFLLMRSGSSFVGRERSAVRNLALFLLIPLSLAHLNMLLSAEIILIDPEFKRQLFNLFVFSVNVLMVFWILVYGKHLSFRHDRSDSPKDINKERLYKRFDITNREKEVIELICLGLTNKEISEKLFISVDTVKDHNSNIFRKTGVKNRTQLAKLFLMS
jgi:DNA-binding CsgD family transcriptional regulator